MQSIAEECEVTPTQLAGFFLRASLRAVKARDCRLFLPPQFELINEPLSNLRLHDKDNPPPKKSK